MRKPPLHDVIVKPVPRGGRPERPEYGDQDSGHRARPEVLAEPRRASVRRRAPVRRPVEQQPAEAYGHAPVDEQPPVYNGGFGDEERQYSKRWLFIALGIGAIVILSSIALSLMFAGASVTVYPRQDTVVVDAEFSAAADTSAELQYKKMVVERTAQQSVVAQDEREVEEKASGMITIYNEYSETPQRLIKRTRFESPDGLIYRIPQAVEVPGKAGDTPGSIEVEVFAEAPGETYNTDGPREFSVPGFEGQPQEGLVYARSAEALTGGFEGVKRTVDEADRKQALEQLENQLRDELLAAAFNSTEKPDGYHLFRESVFFEFSALPDELVETDKVTLSLSGKLHGLLFEEDAFAAQVAQETLGTYDGEKLRIENPSELQVAVSPANGEEAPVGPAWDASNYTVTVEGKAQFIWEFSPSDLARDLAGKEKVVLDMPAETTVLGGYPGIDHMNASIRPFWKKTFPAESEDIVVVTELDA